MGPGSERRSRGLGDGLGNPGDGHENDSRLDWGGIVLMLWMR